MAEDILKQLIIATLLTALILTPSISDAGQFGPPEPVANEKKLSLGVGYFHFSEKLNAENPGELFSARQKIKQNQVYLQAGYGFIKNWELYLRLTRPDLKVDNAFDVTGLGVGGGQRTSDDFKDGFTPSGTLGVKGLLYDGPYLGIGPFFQASLFPNYKDKFRFNAGCSFFIPGCAAAGVAPAVDESKVKRPWDINLGIGLQTKVYGITLYGGPFAYWTGYKARFYIRTEAFGSASRFDETSYREKNNFGGFVGLRTPLPWVEGVQAEVEGQFKNKGSVGVSLHYPF